MTAGHLIHIGYPKTGSNFLRRWFAAHPELRFANRGLAGYENVYAMARQGASPDPGLRWHITSAEGLSTPDERIGRLRIDYSDERGLPMAEAQARVCVTLSSLFPSAHILIVTRGFRAMILSSYSQYVRTGGTDSFESFSRLHAVPWRDAWDYDHLIALYRTAFPGRVFLLPYELLRDDPRAFTGALAGRLGVAPCDPPAARPNAGLSPVELAWYPRLTGLVRALPVGRPLRRRIEGSYLRRAQANRLAALVGLLQRLRPLAPVTEAVLTEEIVAAMWGKAEALRDDPFFQPYLADYFL